MSAEEVRALSLLSRWPNLHLKEFNRIHPWQTLASPSWRLHHHLASPIVKGKYDFMPAPFEIVDAAYLCPRGVITVVIDNKLAIQPLQQSLFDFETPDAGRSSMH